MVLHLPPYTGFERKQLRAGRESPTHPGLYIHIDKAARVLLLLGPAALRSFHPVGSLEGCSPARKQVQDLTREFEGK